MSVTGETPSGWQVVFIRVYNSLATEISRKSPAIQNLEKSDLVYVGFCVERGDCPIEVQELLKKIHNRKIALFGTCGFGQSQNTMTGLWKM